MADFGSNENIMWFWAVLIITVPPVLRFRETPIVPMIATFFVFGFYTQSYWAADFSALGDWPRIIGTCALILGFYYLVGFIVHYFYCTAKSEQLKKNGAFGPILNAWITGKCHVINDDFVAEIRRLKMFEVAWDDVSRFQDGEDLVLTDDVEREPEMLGEVRISKEMTEYEIARKILEERGLL